MEEKADARDENPRQYVWYDYAPTPLDKIILEHMLVDFSKIKDGILIELNDSLDFDTISEHGAASLPLTGLTYYWDTRRFMMEHQTAIREHIIEQAKSGDLRDDNGRILGPVSSVMSYRSMKGYDKVDLEDAAAKALYGPVEKLEEGTLGDLTDTVANAIVWSLVEELAFHLSDTKRDDCSGTEGT